MVLVEQEGFPGAVRQHSESSNLAAVLSDVCVEDPLGRALRLARVLHKHHVVAGSFAGAVQGLNGYDDMAPRAFRSGHWGCRVGMVAPLSARLLPLEFS